MRPIEEQSDLRSGEEVEMRPIINKDDKLLQLYEAAKSGSSTTLTKLIGDDSQILLRVSLSSIPETPLHISALSGHLEITKALLKEKPELASRLDSFKCSPLHLASAEGHTHIVKALLEANTEVCLVADENGRIPLHLAAMMGKVDVIKLLVDEKPESIHQELNGSSVLHLCIQYNQLEALKLLVTVVGNDNQLLESGDDQGSPILHLAVMLRQLETITYLVSVRGIKEKINISNRMGLRALDLLEHYPRDFKSLRVGDILIKAGCRRSTDDDDETPNPPVTILNQQQSVPNVVEQTTQGTAVKRWLKNKIMSVYNKCKVHMRHQSKWVEKMQKTLMLVAILTATISFQVAINPPGGVLQQDFNTTIGNFDCASDGKCLAGTAVMSYVYPELYSGFLIYTIVSFMASVGVVFLAISGLPLRNKLGTWLMTIAMISAIIFLLLTFLLAIIMVTPDHILSTTLETIDITEVTWIGLVAVVVVFGTIRLLFWLVRFLRESKKQQPRPMRNQVPIC